MACSPVAPATYHDAMTTDQPAVVAVTDEQDRISILQLLTLSPTERLQYMLDELEFDRAVHSRDG